MVGSVGSGHPGNGRPIADILVRESGAAEPVAVHVALHPRLIDQSVHQYVAPVKLTQGAHVNAGFRGPGGNLLHGFSGGRSGPGSCCRSHNRRFSRSTASARPRLQTRSPSWRGANATGRSGTARTHAAPSLPLASVQTGCLLAIRFRPDPPLFRIPLHSGFDDNPRLID